MADTIEVIHKLIALAMNNPSEEEARSAAYRAVALITEHQIPIGGQTTAAQPVTLTPEEKKDFEDVLSALSLRKNPDEFTPSTYHQDFDLDDGFMKKRIIEAWRELRRMRKEVSAWIDRIERETLGKYKFPEKPGW